MFYPQRYWLPPPPGAADYAVPVAPGIALSGRFYLMDQEAPTILLFHGNGEVACQYDGLAPFYHQAGANLIAVDYRGYGMSGGEPSIAGMMMDAHQVWRHVSGFLAEQGFTGPRFVKGRSLGSQPALEIAAYYQDDMAGLIIESGFSGTERLFGRFSQGALPPHLQRVLALHQEKLHAIGVPVLIIHGEQDELIPLEMAVELHDSVGSVDKEMLVIPGAGHNDLLMVDPSGYFGAIAGFMQRHGGMVG